MQAHPSNLGQKACGRAARMRAAATIARSERFRHGLRSGRPSGPIARGVAAPAHTYRCAAHNAHFMLR